MKRYQQILTETIDYLRMHCQGDFAAWEDCSTVDTLQEYCVEILGMPDTF